MRMLVIEDDIDIASFLKKSFEAEMFAVDIEHDGERGSYMARTNNYDIIILDNMLPNKEGSEICKDVRDSGIDVPILMLTVRSDVAEKILNLNAGIDDYVTKPYSFEELLARVRALLRRNKVYQATLLTYGGLVMNCASQEVTMHNKSVYLTRKEFSLLELLVRNQGNVVSRGVIMEHVWDVNGDPFSRTIETHILNLRKKIGGKNKSFIQNIPGRGYKIQMHGTI